VLEPFRIRVDDAVLADLRRRLAATRLPDEPAGGGWDYGTDRGTLAELLDYWRDGFDWRRVEDRLNRYRQYRVRIGPDLIHLVHVPGDRPGRLPLIFSHGWPSTFVELLPMVDRLADEFDVVVPSLPGFGFSAPVTRRGPRRVHQVWAELMSELGYHRFGACGSDIGARVTSALGRDFPDRVVGIHLSSVDLDWPQPLPDDLDPAELDYLDRSRRWDAEEGGYAAIQSTRPQSLAYGLVDSPAGLAGWLLEKYRTWSDCGGDLARRFSPDDLLTHLTIYWVTGTINSANRTYFEKHPDRTPKPSEPVTVPTAVAMFPGEAQLLVPRQFAARAYRLRRWTDMPRGGHFPAHEEPELLGNDHTAFYRTLR